MHRPSRSGLLLASAVALVVSVACSGAGQPASPTAPKSESAAAAGGSGARDAARPPGAPTAASQAAAVQAPVASNRATGVVAPGAAPQPVPTSAPAGDANPQLPIVQNLGRMIVYTADVTLLVDDLDSLPERVGTIAMARGGYVAGVETKDEGGVPTTIVRLKVPPQRYDETMGALRGLAVEVRDQKATTRDVTEEYSDTQTQVASLEATHAQLLELMKRTASVEELLKVQQQAAQVKLQIDRLKGRASALERLSDLASITIRGQLASAALGRDYVSERAALRKAEVTRASLELQLTRARNPEEEATIRDRLGEVQLEIERRQARLADLARKAESIHVALPAADPDGAPRQGQTDISRQYIDTRIALRRAQRAQQELTDALRAGRPDVDAAKLTEAILSVNQLSAQLKAVQERATQLGVALPTITPEQEAVLAGEVSAAGGPGLPAPVISAWNASLGLLTAAASAIVFFWWLAPILGAALAVMRLRRRPYSPFWSKPARADG